MMMVCTTLTAARASQLPLAVNAVISACKKSVHAVTRIAKMNMHATVVLMTTMGSMLIKNAQTLLAVSWQSAMIMIEVILVSAPFNQGEKARWSRLSVIIHQHSSACLRLNSGNFHTTQSGGVTGVGVLNNYW
jgi:hypothetical protein